MQIRRVSFFLVSIGIWILPLWSQLRVSIITSIYKGDEFIKGFMEDITQQTIFDQCELILINANSPEHEEEVILPYLARYPNIIYKRLQADPGLYGVWNVGVQLSQANYLTNANIDDRLRPDCYEVHAKALDNYPEVDLVYSACYVTTVPNDIFDGNAGLLLLPHTALNFSPQHMTECLPNNHPMWRKSMHKKYGLFDERYKAAGDWEMWLRAVKGGSRFLRIPGVYGLYYDNPSSISNRDKVGLSRRETQEVGRRYQELFYPEWARKHGYKKAKHRHKK
ncbi:MAG: glycosyltransferase [Candidatus Cloacimonetes bacterium]|nr:glycosyltransferase [Candidatus Cloacimonadota bacterium]